MESLYKIQKIEKIDTFSCILDHELDILKEVIPSESIILCIPAYNEENEIASVISASREYIDYIFVIDDGSLDNTSQIAISEGAIVIKHASNKGYGATLNTCFDVGRIINASSMIILDGDGQHNPKDIPKFISKLNDSNDIVIGSRFIGDNLTKIPHYRKLGIKILDIFTNLCLNNRITDSQCGYRAYSHKAINNIIIKDKGMSAGSEILIHASYNNMIISEIPINVRYDVNNCSSQNPILHGLSILFYLINKKISL